jgi:hypothetical protein
VFVVAPCPVFPAVFAVPLCVASGPAKIVRAEVVPQGYARRTRCWICPGNNGLFPRRLTLPRWKHSEQSIPTTCRDPTHRKRVRERSPRHKPLGGTAQQGNVGYSSRLNGNDFLNSGTVQDDGATDILDGGSGRDWFFANTDHSDAGHDIVLDATRHEIVTNIDLDV